MTIKDTPVSYVGLGALAAGIALVTLVVQTSSRPATVTLTATTLAVQGGGHAAEVPVAAIDDVTLVRTLSGIGRKRNAFQFGNVYAGRFELRPFGDGMVFVDATRPPYVVVHSAAGAVLFNAADSGRTRVVYDSLVAMRTPRTP